MVRINQDGTWTLIANISAFVQNNPVQQLPPGDYIAEGEPHTMVAVDGDLYVVEANSGQLLRVTTGGQISRVSDLSVGHPVPAAVAYRDGRFYVGDLGVFPIWRGAVKIHAITPGREKILFAEGLTAILGLAFDRQGQLYALETANVDNQGPQPGTGRVVRITSSGLVEVASGLTFPTGMTMGPDGNLYVSHCGYCFEPGKGELVRINLQSDPGMPLPETSVEGAPVTFPETGYSLEGDFLAYWRENGGLPVFGYPIDSARQVDSQVAQWLERVRLELHPANAAPYRVLLSRLGVEALARQGVDWQGLPKASPSAPHYFKATGHAIAYGPFWSY